MATATTRPSRRRTSPTISSLIAAIEAAFEVIRTNHPDLKRVDPPLFILQSDRRGSKLAHFAAGRWVESAKNGSKPQERHEIALVSEQLKNRKPEDVFGTLLHEAAHALGHVRGIKNTSASGTYHNQKFQGLATECGLSCAAIHEQYGYGITKLTPETKAKYKAQIALLAKALQFYRIGLSAKTKGPDRNYIKCECDVCGGVIRVSSTWLAEVIDTMGTWPCPMGVGRLIPAA